MTDATPAPGRDRETDAGRDTYVAVVITHDRAGVLAALTREATAHLGHDRYQVRDLRVVTAGADGTLLATAEFSPRATPQAVRGH